MMNFDKILDLFKKMNLSDLLENILKYSLIGMDKFWGLIIYITKISLNLSYIVVFFVTVWTIVYLVLKKINTDLADNQKEITIKLLKENFYGSEMYEAGENLVASIYGAIASIVNTLALVISLSFTGFALLIAYPFRFLQNISERINFKLEEMRTEQQVAFIRKRQLRKERIKERVEILDGSCREKKREANVEEGNSIEKESDLPGKNDIEIQDESCGGKEKGADDSMEIKTDPNLSEKESIELVSGYCEEEEEDLKDEHQWILSEIEIPNDLLKTNDDKATRHKDKTEGTFRRF